MTETPLSNLPARPPARAAGRWLGRRSLAVAPILLGIALLVWLGVSYGRTAGQASVRASVRGLITGVETRDIGHAQSLTVHAADGRDWQFAVDPSVDMTPGHMREHMTFGQPVTVFYRRAGSALVATGVTD